MRNGGECHDWLMMGKTSRRAYEARKIRDRAKRAISALERDVAAGNISKAFASRREQSLRELIRQNSYDRQSKSYGTSSAVAARSAERIFRDYSAESAQRMRALSDSDRKKQITPLKEKAFRADLEAALRGELSLERMEDAEAFIRSTAGIWAGYSPEKRLDVLAEKLGYLEGKEDSLIRAYRRWKREVKNGEDYQGTSFDDECPSCQYNSERVSKLEEKYGRKNTEKVRTKKNLKAQYD